jgi:putative ABC transport system permease protein
MIGLFRLAVRTLLPELAARHADDMAGIAAQLADDARRSGVRPWLRYWLIEFKTLILIAWTQRPRRKVGVMLSNLLQDVRYSLRLMLRTPGVTFVAILTLALGIGANTAIFSIINGVILRPLPLKDPDRLYLVQHALISDRTQLATTSPGNFFDIQRASRQIQPMAGFSGATVTMTGRGEPERLQGIASSGSILEVAGVQPALGRIFTAAEASLDHPPVMVISHGLWQRLFGGSPDVLGQTITLGGTPVTVIGVMPKGFSFPDTNVDFWAPERLSDKQKASRTEYYLTILGRLAPGATADSARAELNTIMETLRKDFPLANNNATLEATPLAEALVGNVTDMLWMLMASVGCVLLIACANLANLLLSKAAGRGREIAIRQAIGAARGRVIRQMLVESMVLGLIGGLAGVLVGRFFLDALVAWLPTGIPRIAEASIDRGVLLFTLAIALSTGVLFGLAPALQLGRSAPALVLRHDVRTSTGRSRLRAILVVAEVAVALVLLAGAGLLIRSFSQMQRVDPGFSTARILTFQVRMEGAAYENAAQRIAFVNNVVERLKALPGVTAAAASSTAPIAGRGNGAWFNLVARPWPAGTTPPGIPYRVITADYFKTMNIALVRGRLLAPSDSLTGTPSVVISESLARRFWKTEADGDPVGAEIYLGAPDYKLFDRATVVGIVKDVKLAGLGNPLTDAVYGLNTLMPWWRNFTFTVRTQGEPKALASSVRQIVRETDPLLAVTAVQAMTDIMRTSLAPIRASMLLLVLFAGVAVVMAAIGVFGVMSYTVNLRAREMGIRLALGARPADVRWMVVISGMKQALIGVAIGLAAAAWLTRLMTSQLFQVTPGDPLTLASVAVMLLATAALACYLPARRATRLDPLVVLRTE